MDNFPEKRRLIVMRHGQSVGNIARDESFKNDNDSHYNNTDFMRIDSDHWELTELGREQSKMAGDFLRQVLFLDTGTYISSNTARARQTAAYVFPNAILNINEPLVRERSYSGLDKVSKKQWTDILEQEGIPRQEDSYNWKVPGGESAKEVESRVKKFLERIHSDGEDTQETFIITHGDFIQVLRVLLHKIPEESYTVFKNTDDNYVRNCQVFIFELRRDSQELVSEESYFFEQGHWYKGLYHKKGGKMIKEKI